jgi:hypothetical protein
MINIVMQDGSRREFLIHLLKCHENEAKDNISDVVRKYLRSIKE